MPPRTYNERFLREIGKLNEAQRQAVDQIEGPMLVIAGPGTGKTHILAARIGRILLETDTQAQNILCLTFTDAGVQAMRNRLLEWIGPEAHRVHIFTFHSFCNSIIQDNIELFGHRELEPVTDLERIEIIRDLLGELPADHLLKRQVHNPFQYEQQLADLFQRIKGENWTADQVLEQIGRYVESLPGREEYRYKVNTRNNKKGDLKEADYQAAVERMEKLGAGVKLYPRFQELMAEHRRYDYDDMILWVLDAFGKYPFLLRTYQERYLYFLVDEYQDTNGSQHAVLQNLISFWDEPNIFIVGDDDQSIYEFQGARLKNLVDFYTAHPGVEVVVLKENYRSAQGILDAAHSLIQRNEKRIINLLSDLGLEKKLRAAGEETADLDVSPQLVIYPNAFHELADLLNQVDILRKKGVPLEEIAFIYPWHKQGEPLRNLLAKRGIPYQVRRKVNVLDLPIIRQVRRLLEYLYAEQKEPYSGEALLFPLLHDGYWDISPAGLALLSKKQKREKENGEPERIPWRDLLRDPDVLAECSGADREAILRCNAVIDEFLRLLPGWPVVRILEALFTRAGVLEFILKRPQYDNLLQAASTLMGFAQAESLRNPRLTLEDFLLILAKMDANNLPIELKQPATVDKGVNLLTAHGAKGLEFDYVFLFDAVDNYWEPRASQGAFRFAFPDTLTFSGEEDAMEARRRLFYVGMTRARKGLQISFARVSAQGKDQKQALFFDELADSGLPRQEKQTDPMLVMDTQALMLQETPELPPADRLDPEVAAAYLTGFQLSISSLNTYLRCPLSFYFEYVLQAPQQESVAGMYGIAAHRALQGYFNRMRNHPDRAFPAPDLLPVLFETEWSAFMASVPEEEFSHRLELGKKHLRDYAQAHLSGWPKDVRIELNLRQVELDGVPVQGKIDKVEYLDVAGVRLVDYKTGKADKKKWKKPDPKEPLGGIYWRQLAFYTLLFQSSREGSHAVRDTLISFIDPDEKGRFTDQAIAFTPEELAFVTGLVKDAYARILQQDFYKGCGEPGCPWCDFVKEKSLLAELSNRESEELDDNT